MPAENPHSGGRFFVKHRTAALSVSEKESLSGRFPNTAVFMRLKQGEGNAVKNKNDKRVFMAICTAAARYRFLTAATFICVAASVAASLISPLLLARVIDRLTKGVPLTLTAALLYFGSFALEGILSSAQEALLVLFGQKMTHALRYEMS